MPEERRVPPPPPKDVKVVSAKQERRVPPPPPPVKKKESTQSVPASNTPQSSSNGAPVNSAKQVNGSTSTLPPNNNPLLGDLNKANTILNQNIGPQNQNIPVQSMNAQGNVINNNNTPTSLANVPRKSAIVVAPIGNPASNDEFTRKRLEETRNAMESELSYAKTDEQKSQIMARYRENLSSLESQLNQVPSTPITKKEKPIELVKTDNVASTLIPEKKELPSSLSSGYGIGESYQQELFDAVMYNFNVDEIEKIVDIDEEALSNSKDFTPAQVQDILLLKNSSVDILNKNIPEDKKASLIASRAKALDSKISAESEAMQIQNDAATEGRTVADLQYDQKKNDRELILENMLNEDKKEFSREYSEALYELKDLMSFLSDKRINQKGQDGRTRNGGPIISYDEKGNVVINGFENESQKDFYQSKIEASLKKIEEIKKKSYNIQQEKITEKERDVYNLSNSISKRQAHMSKMDKSSEAYKTLSAQIEEDKKQLASLKKDVSSLKTEGNIMFKTNPNDVAKSIISEGGKGVKLAFSSLPENLSSKEKFDLAYQRLLKTVQQQEQDLGIDGAKIAQMTLKDLTIGLSPEELEYRKNKMALSSMAPMYLFNESGITNEGENFMDAFLSGFSNWIIPNMAGAKTQTSEARTAVQGISEMGLQADYSQDTQESIEDRAKGPEGIWNQEFWGETSGLMLGIVAEMAATSNILKLAKVGQIGNVTDEIYSVYDRSMKSTKLGRFFLPVVDEALKAELTGQIFENAEDELNFENFMVGGTAGKLLGTMLSSVPASKRMDVIYSIFGTRTKEAVQAIKNRAAGGAGEVVQEFGEELTGIYNDELRTRGFWDEVTVRFGDTDELQKFIVSSFLMGAVMHSKVNQKAQDELSKLPPEEKAKVEEIINESIKDSNAVNTDVEEVINEEVQKSDAIEKIEEEVTTEEPIAPDVVVEEAKAKEQDEEKVVPDANTPIETNTTQNETTTQPTETDNTQVTSDTEVVSENTGVKNDGDRSNSARNDSRAKQAREVDHVNPRGAVLKYFIEGGKVLSSAIKEIYGKSESSVSDSKKITGEYNSRIGLINNKQGRSIDDVAHQLWEENSDQFPSFTSTDYRDALIDVLSEYNGTSGMIDEILVGQNLDQQEADYYESVYGEEAKGYEDVIAEAEGFLNQLSPEEQQEYVDNFEAAQSKFENQFRIFESSKAKANPTKSVKAKSKLIADNIRKLKAPIDLSKLSSSPKPLFDAAWNTAIEATAKTIEAGGSIAQAVYNGIEAIKNTEWYNKLSDEGKKQAEEGIKANLESVDFSNVETDSKKVDSEKETGKKKRRFAKNVMKSDVSKKIKKGITEEGKEYIPISNSFSVKEANDYIDKYGVEQSSNIVLDFNNELSPRVRVTLGIQLVKKLDAIGDNRSYDLAANLADELSKFGTELGQGTQAFALWNNLSADGIIRKFNKNQQSARQAVRKRNSGTYSRVKNTTSQVKKTASQKAVQNVFSSSTKKVNQIKAFGLSKTDIEKRKQAARDKFKKSKGSTLTSGGLNSEAIEALVEYGAMIFADGVRTFKEWAGEMKSVFGVSESEAKKIWESESVFDNKTLSELSEVAEIKTVISSQLQKSSDANELSSLLQETFAIPKELADGLSNEISKEYKKIAKAEFDKQVSRALRKGMTKATKEFLDNVSKTDMSESDVETALDEYFGIRPMDQSQIDEIKRLADIRDSRPEGFLQDNATTDILTYIDKLNGIPKSEIAWSLWYSSILSGYETQMLNIGANIINIGMESFVTTIQKAVIDKDPKALTGYISEMLKGFASTGKDESIQILSTGQSARKLSKKLESKDALEAKVFKGGNVNPFNWAKYVSRFMFSVDAGAFVTIKAGQIALLAREMAQEEGLYGDALNKRVSEILNNSTSVKESADIQATEEIEAIIEREGSMSESKKKRMIRLRSAEIVAEKIPEEINEAANSFSAKTTFNYKPEGWLGLVAQGIQNISREAWALRVIVPFTGVVANVLNQQIDYTPYGYLRAYGRNLGSKTARSTSAKNDVEKQRALIKATIGTVALFGIYALAAMYDDDDDPLFDITGKGPSDFNKANQLRNQGWRPYSFKIGNKYISYQYTPLGLILSSVGNYRDNEKYKELGKKARTQKLAASILLSAQSAMDMSFLTGMSSLFTFLSSNSDAEKTEEKLLKFVGKTGTSFIPNLIKQIDKKFDPTMYDATGAGSAILSDIPFARSYFGKPKLNSFGEPIKKTGNRFFGTADPNDVWRFMAEHKLFAPGASPSTKTLAGEEMTDEEFYRYIELSGKRAKEIIVPMIPALNDYFKDIDGVQKKKIIDKIFSQARKEAKYTIEYEKK